MSWPQNYLKFGDQKKRDDIILLLPDLRRQSFIAGNKNYDRQHTGSFYNVWEFIEIQIFITEIPLVPDWLFNLTEDD